MKTPRIQFHSHHDNDTTDLVEVWDAIVLVHEALGKADDGE